jgi:hypothetical protein
VAEAERKVPEDDLVLVVVEQVTITAELALAEMEHLVAVAVWYIILTTHLLAVVEVWVVAHQLGLMVQMVLVKAELVLMVSVVEAVAEVLPLEHLVAEKVLLAPQTLAVVVALVDMLPLDMLVVLVTAELRIGVNNGKTLCIS